MVERFLVRVLLERVGDRVVEIFGLSAFFSWLPHLVRGEQAPRQSTVGVS